MGERAKGEFLFFPNSDMIFFPGWDTALSEGIKKYGNQNVYSSTLIEPKGDNESCY